MTPQLPALIGPEQATVAPLRIGLLGAARISDLAVITPAHDAGHRVVAVAARDAERARRWALDRGVERVVPSYANLVEDPDVDVVYNALPNSLHTEWNIAAINAGKHLLSEKPFSSNATEAAGVRDVAGGSDRVVFEAFHYRYHPVFERLLRLTTDGTVGRLKHVAVTMSTPPPPENDLRWSWPLAGGALMDLGCYAIHVIRSLAHHHGGTPELVTARAVERPARPQVDESAHLEFRLPQDVSAVADVTMDGPWIFRIDVAGTSGSATVANFINVHHDDRVIVRTSDEEHTEHLGRRSSYHYQMDALTAAVTQSQSFPTGVDDAVANMELIDECYLAAGFRPRQGHVALPDASNTGSPVSENR